MYKIYVRDQSFNRVAELDDYTSLEMIIRFNAVGSWILVLPTDTDAAKELSKPKSGIIVVKNGTTLLSGPVTSRNRKWNSNEDSITFGGSDDNVHLFRNLAYPIINRLFSESFFPFFPIRLAPSTDEAYDVRTGTAESIMKEYVSANIGPNARHDRRKVYIEPNTGLGKTVTGRARFHSLLELCQSLALSGGGLGFRLAQVNKILEFQVYQPTDNTTSVFFSPLLGNLLDFEFSSEDPETNSIILGGGGEGVERILLEKGNSTNIAKFDRIETFVDKRDSTDITELYQTLDEELTAKGEKTSLSITPIDTPSLMFGRDYNLGDKVSVVLTQPNEQVTIETLHYFISAYQIVPEEFERTRKIQEKLEVIKDVVREIKITITPEGERISPVIGTVESLTGKGIFDRIKRITKRVSNLERS